MESRVKTALEQWDKATRLKLRANVPFQHIKRSRAFLQDILKKIPVIEEPGALSKDVDTFSKCHPWSHDKFLERVNTFEIWKWFAKPSLIGPYPCARYGWINSGEDKLKCECCGAYLCFKLDENLEVEAVNRLALVFSQQLDTGHEARCPWKSNPSPESFSRLRMSTRSEIAKEFSNRLINLVKLMAQSDSSFGSKSDGPVIPESSGEVSKSSDMPESDDAVVPESDDAVVPESDEAVVSESIALPVPAPVLKTPASNTFKLIAPEFIAQVKQNIGQSTIGSSCLSLEEFLEKLFYWSVKKCKKVNSKQLEQSLEEVTLEDRLLAVFIALVGWEVKDPADSQNYGLIGCRYCNRTIGLWNFSNKRRRLSSSSNASFKNTINPLNEHRWFCPWVAEPIEDKKKDTLSSVWQTYLLLPGWLQCLKALETRCNDDDEENDIDDLKKSKKNNSTSIEPIEALDLVRQALNLSRC